MGATTTTGIPSFSTTTRSPVVYTRRISSPKLFFALVAGIVVCMNVQRLVLNWLDLVNSSHCHPSSSRTIWVALSLGMRKPTSWLTQQGLLSSHWSFEAKSLEREFQVRCEIPHQALQADPYRLDAIILQRKDQIAHFSRWHFVTSHQPDHSQSVRLDNPSALGTGIIFAAAPNIPLVFPFGIARIKTLFLAGLDTPARPLILK